MASSLQMKKVGTLASGETVLANEGSQRYKGTARFLARALARVNAHNPEDGFPAGEVGMIIQSVDFGRPIGNSNVVATRRDGEIRDAQRRAGAWRDEQASKKTQAEHFAKAWVKHRPDEVMPAQPLAEEAPEEFRPYLEGKGEVVVYARRKLGAKDRGLSRFVKNRQPEPSSEVTVVLKRQGDTFLLLGAFFGGVPEPQPWDKRATACSEEFWNTHAFVWGSEEVDEQEPATTKCPWTLPTEKHKWAIPWLLLCLVDKGLTVDFRVGGRIFQITGHPGIVGLWERHLHVGSHPTRSRVGEAEVEKAFRAVCGHPFVLYSTQQDEPGAEWLSRQEVAEKFFGNNMISWEREIEAKTRLPKLPK